MFEDTTDSQTMLSSKKLSKENQLTKFFKASFINPITNIISEGQDFVLLFLIMVLEW